MNKITITTLVLGLWLLISVHSAQAADVGLINIKTNDQQLFSFTSDGTKTNSETLTGNEPWLFSIYSNREAAWLGDYLTANTGLELITQEGIGGTDHAIDVVIISQAGTELHRFSAGRRAAIEYNMAVGQVVSNQTTDVVLCSARRPAKLRIYTYDTATNVGTEALNFEPFANFTDDNGQTGSELKLGCDGVMIGDYDNDGSNDIAVGKVKQDSGDFKVLVFNANGTFQKQVNFTTNSATSGYTLVGSGDIDNDGQDEFLVRGGDKKNNGQIIVANEDGVKYIITNNQDDFGNIVAMADVDGDSKSEVITYRGKLGNIYVHDEAGVVEHHFQAFADSPQKVGMLFLGDFSSLYSE